MGCSHCRPRAANCASVALLLAGLGPSRSVAMPFLATSGAAPLSLARSTQPAAAAFLAAGQGRKRPRRHGTLIPASLHAAHAHHHHTSIASIRSISTPSPLRARPKSGSVVESYRTVSVSCSRCRTRLFRYKKKNGTKSNLVKCYIERISDDMAGILGEGRGGDDGGGDDGEASGAGQRQEQEQEEEWSCPECGQRFGRRALIHGRPAIKLVGGKVRMTKK